MTEIVADTKVVQCKHFPVDAERSFVQFEISMSETEYNQNKVEETKQDNKGKVLIQCLDRSGSMSGTPYDAVKVGATKLCDTLLGQQEQPFERFITIFYESNVEVFESKDIEQYKHAIDKSDEICGGTDFIKVFCEIKTFIEMNKSQLSDITVIFFTDGCA